MNHEHPNAVDVVLSDNLDTGNTIHKPAEIISDKDSTVPDSPRFKCFSDVSPKEAEKGSSRPGSTDETITVGDPNNNRELPFSANGNCKGGCLLTENQKEQLLSLLKVDKKAPSLGGTKETDDASIKQLSGSLHMYPPYGQTEVPITFNAIPPAVCSVSPRVNSDISYLERSVPVPNTPCLPIAVPIFNMGPATMASFCYLPQDVKIPYTQAVMPPTHFVPTHQSLPSKKAVASTSNGRAGNVFSELGSFHRSENQTKGLLSDQERESRHPRRSTKGSKLPRPIWPKSISKGRKTPLEFGMSSIDAVRQRTSSTQDLEGQRNVKHMRARTLSSSLESGPVSKASTRVRSQTFPVYWTRDEVKRAITSRHRTWVSTDSLSSWKPSSSSNSFNAWRSARTTPENGFKRTGGARPYSPHYRERSHSTASSQSSSSVALPVSKLEQMSKDFSDKLARSQPSFVTSSLSKIGSSPLVAEDRMARGQLKSNLSAKPQAPARKRSATFPGNAICSLEGDTSRASMYEGEGSYTNSYDYGEWHRRGSEVAAAESRTTVDSVSKGSQSLLSGSLGSIYRGYQSLNPCNISDENPSENCKEWSSLEHLCTNDATSLTGFLNSSEDNSCDGQRKDSFKDIDSHLSIKGMKEFVQARLCSMDDLSTEEHTRDDETKANTWSSEPLRNVKSDSARQIIRKESLDSEPVREKISPKPKPRSLSMPSKEDTHIRNPTGSNSISSKDFNGLSSDTQDCEIMVDLAVLESSSAFPSSPSSPEADSINFPFKGSDDGRVSFPTGSLGPGTLNDFQSSNYLNDVPFKCGDMEPERDTNCVRQRSFSDSVEVDGSKNIPNKADKEKNYVKRLERKMSPDSEENEDETLPSIFSPTSLQNLLSRNSVRNTEVSIDTHSLSSTDDSSSKYVSKTNPRPPVERTASSTQGSFSSATTKNSSHSWTNQSKTDQIIRPRRPLGDISPVTDETPLELEAPPISSTGQNLPWKIPRQDFSDSLYSNGDSLKGNVLSKRGLQSNPYVVNSPLDQDSFDASVATSVMINQSHLLSHCSIGEVPLQGDTENSTTTPNTSNRPMLAGCLHPKRNQYERYPQEKFAATRVNPDKKQTSKTAPTNSLRGNERDTSSSASKNSSHCLHSMALETPIEAAKLCPIRFPYSRSANSPATNEEEAINILRPAKKTVSNPSSTLYPGNSNFIESCHRSCSGGTNDITSKSWSKISSPKEGQQRLNMRVNKELSLVSQLSSPPSGVEADPQDSFASSVLLTPSQLVHFSNIGNCEDSEVSYNPSRDKSVSVSDTAAVKDRFPSSSSSDSGLNPPDGDDPQGGSATLRNQPEKRSRLWSRPASPPYPPLPTSQNSPLRTRIFYNPGCHVSSNEKALNSAPKGSQSRSPTFASSEPTNVDTLSEISRKGRATDFPWISIDPSKDPSLATASSIGEIKNPRENMPRMQDNKTEKPSMKTALPQVGHAAFKDSLVKGAPLPELCTSTAKKSDPTSARVDSKELLGQLVKRILTTAAAKQSSSPKASFQEKTNFMAKCTGRNKGSPKNLFFLPEDKETDEQETICTTQRSTVAGSKTNQLSDAREALQVEEKEMSGAKESIPNRIRQGTTLNVSSSSPLTGQTEPVTPSKSCGALRLAVSAPEEQPGRDKEKKVLSKVIDMIHDEFAFDGYLDDGVEDLNMAVYVMSLAGMSEENFKEAIADQFSDLYWDEDFLKNMFQAVTDGQQNRGPTLHYSEDPVSDTSPPESDGLSRVESSLSLEAPCVNSISRSSSERSGTSAGDVFVSPLGEPTEFLPVKVIAPEFQLDIQKLLVPIYEDYHRLMGVKLAPSVEDLVEKMATKIMEISQQMMLERKAKKKSMNSFNKLADVENKKDVKDLAIKLVNEIEESDKKIIYLKNVQRQLRNAYAERFGLDTSLLQAFLVSYNKTCVALEPEVNNTFLHFSPIWNQRASEAAEIVEESLTGPSLQSGTKLGLFSYLFDRHAMSQAYVRYFLYTYRYICTPTELFNFIREKCSTSLRTDSSGQVYNHQLQIRYRAFDLLSEWIEFYYRFDFKMNPELVKELLAFIKDEVILVDRSERGHYLIKLISEKRKQEETMTLMETTDSVAVLQLEDPQGLSLHDSRKESPKKPSLGSRKAKSSLQCFKRTKPDKVTTYKPTLYLKALSVLDHSPRTLGEHLTRIQQDLFLHIHPIHFLNSRSHGIGVGRSQSPSRDRNSIFGFSTGSRRDTALLSTEQGSLPWGQNLYVSGPKSDGCLEALLEHAQDVSLWVAVEICRASSIKVQLALITKFVSAARYCCEIRNYSTCIQIIDGLEMFVVRQLPVWKQVPSKTTEALEGLKAVKVLLKTDSAWLMKSDSSREQPTIPCVLLFVMHVQQVELGGFTLPNDMYKWTKMRSVARLVDQIRLFKQMRYAFQTEEGLKDRINQRICECKSENLHALASENASNFHSPSSSQGSRKFHDAFKKMKATLGGHN